MNYQSLLLNAFVDRIGMALVYFLWQGAAIAVVLGVVLRILRHRSPQSRYLAAWTALLAMTVCLPTTAYFLPSAPRAEIAAHAALPNEELAQKSPVDRPAKTARTESPRTHSETTVREKNDTQSAEVPNRVVVVSPRDTALNSSLVPPRDSSPAKARWSMASSARLLQPALPWIVGLWLFGAMTLAVWHLGGFRHLVRLKRRGTGPAPANIEQIVCRLASRLGIRHSVSVLVSQMARVPTVLGWLRPVILLPASILCEMPPEQLEMILAHELAHIRRLDYLWNLLQIAIETVLFYHPAVWWVSRRIREERENCCDGQAVAAMGNPLVYAGALMRLAEIRCQLDETPALAGNIAADGGSLESRIRRVLGLSDGPARNSNAWLGGILAVLLLAAILSVGIAWAGGRLSQEDTKTASNSSNKTAQPAETLFPKSTQAFIAIANIDSLIEHFNNTQLGNLAADPAMKLFMESLKRQLDDCWSNVHDRLGMTLDDLRGVSGGEVGIGLIEPLNDESVIAITVDIADHSDRAKEMLDKISKNFVARGATRSVLESAKCPDPITLFSLESKRSNAKSPRVRSAYYCLRGNFLCTTNNLEIMHGILARQAGKGSPDDALAGQTSFQTISRRCSADSPQAAPQLRWFISPVGCVAAACADMPREQRRKGNAILNFMRIQGFTAFQGVGGHASFADGSYDFVHRTAVYAPGPHKNSMKMLKLLNGADYAPQDWAPRDIATYSTFYLDVRNAFQNFGPMFDQLCGGNEQGVWNETLQALRNDPQGPRVDLGRELIEHLGQRVTLVTDYRTPITPSSEQILLAVEVRPGEDADVAKAIAKLMGKDPTVRNVKFKGRSIWQVVEQDEPKDGGLDDNGDEREEWLFPHGAITVADGQLFIASDFEILAKALTPHQPQELLRNDAEYRLVNESIENMQPEDNCLRVFSRAGEEYRLFYELIRRNKMPEGESMLCRLLNQLLGEGGNGRPRHQKIDGSQLPEYDVVRRYFNSAGSRVAAEKDGWFIKGFILKNASTEERKAASDESASIKTSMTADEFGKLSEPEQRDLLVKAFGQHLEQGRNLFYETEQVYQAFDSKNWQPGKPTKRYDPYHRYLYRNWQLGDSFKTEMFRYDDPKQTDFHLHFADVENARERINRNMAIYKPGETNQIQGFVDYPHKELTLDDRFHSFPSPDDLMSCSGSQQYFFQYLMSRKDKCEIKSPVAGGKVQLVVAHHGEKQVFILDPQKGFLPIRFDARFDIPATKDRERFWYEVKFEVQESRLVDNVWMPVKMRSQSLSYKDVLVIQETRVLRTESGSVKPADLVLPFTKGMRVADVILGITYTVDSQGYATDIKDSSTWKHERPKGWRKGEVDEAYSLASRIRAADRKQLVDRREAESKPIDEALKVLRADPPAAQEERIEAAVKILRVCPAGDRQRDWGTAVRELITIGKPAVPKLIEELDRTESERGLRAMGFVLRGIGDPRAVPALIRAIPRLIQPASSDCGFTIKDDPELLKFIWMHDLDHIGNNKEPVKFNGLTLFSYERSIREIMSALEKLTRQSHGWHQLDSAAAKADDVMQLRRQRTLFLDHAKLWADWWSHNWKDFVADEADAQLAETKKSLDQLAATIAKMPQSPPPSEIPCGPRVRIDGGVAWRQFDPYVNLDIGRQPSDPGELLRNSPKDHPSPELLAWAQREGADLLRIEIKRPGDSKTYYGYQPVGMKVWKIDNKRFKNLDKELQKSKKLDLPPLWEGPISSIDRQTGDIDPEEPASFLFITREGACGTIQIRSALVHQFVQGAATTGSCLLEYQYIFQSEPEKPTSKKDKPAANPVSVKGIVSDENSKPLAGADVWLPIFIGVEHVLHVKTDGQGRFVLEIPAAWYAEIKPWDRAVTIWAHAADRQLNTKVVPLPDAPEAAIQLGPAVDTSFVIVDPQGQPCAGVLVEPYYVKTSMCFEPLPDELMARLAVRTDGKGRVKLPTVSEDILFEVRVKAEGFGIQVQRVEKSQPPAIVGRTIHLRPVGKIEGRLFGGDPVLFNARLIITTDDVGSGPRPAWPTEGFADVRCDGQGHFSIPAIAAGVLRIDVLIDKNQPNQPLCPKLPDFVRLDADKTVSLEIPMAPTVAVRGSLRAKDTGKPLAGILMHIYYGVARQGANPVTDAQGNYTARVLPGSVGLQVITPPKGYEQLGDVGNRTINVPADAKMFDLPTLELVPAGKLTGNVIDQYGQPAANVSINVTDEHRSYGGAKTDSNGRFEATDVPLELDPANMKYQWMEEGPFTGWADCKIVKAKPLVLRVYREKGMTPTSEASPNKTSPPSSPTQSKRSQSISGRVLYHDGTPAVGASVFLVGKVSTTIGDGKAWQGIRSDNTEDKTVTKTTTDADGRFTLPGGDAKRIVVSAPRLDFWVVAVLDWVPVAKGDPVARPEFTIKLPEPGRLVVKYDIPGGDAKAKLFLQVNTWDAPLSSGIHCTRGPLVANKGQVVLDNLPPCKCCLDREKNIAYGTNFCDRRSLSIESGKTLESNFIRDRGTAVVGQVVGLKKEMCASVCAAPNTAGALVSVRSPEAKDGIFSDLESPLFDILKCGLDGRFSTEQLLPGKYAIVVEAWLPENPEEMQRLGIRRSSFIGSTVVTVPESGPPLHVKVELKPRENTPPAKPAKDGKKSPSSSLKLS